MSAFTFTLSLNILISLFSVLVEAFIGYPNGLYKKIKHPVVWIGALISFCDKTFNKPGFSPQQQLLFGGLSVFFCSLLSIILGFGLQATIFHWLHTPLAILVCGLLASTLLASRSLYHHFQAVQEALENSSLTEARKAVSQIVGRETAALDQAAIIRAAIESLAENFSDGVCAPLLWGFLGGLPGMCFYKTINTADSMIGHLTPTYRYFGWAAAKIDDLINWPAARLSAIWFILAAFTLHPSAGASAFATAKNFSRRHRSPNAGWPEAAMAGAIKLRLSGPRIYHGKLVNESWLGDFLRPATVQDMVLALTVFKRACLLQIIILYGISLFLLALI
ncbi:adenosylcobinamide-phosphate synthase CbiB [Entomobacter blattae]|uniref:Cobalamin biosynthesis protein CobD n=1 Tax=Entomobacter blattae TaxID=2762277 RepID=A0A7H1NQ42_9PROT|nr:adenosylcobinamide-phosphate synthase CbiB [Entomobacter blattae]QNT77902.1 Cobalamin biosynthesis protein CbiB [Entomobacter blattae]